MAYFIDLFSPGTYEAFRSSDQTISGFRKTQWPAARKVQRGDYFICYMTKLSRWIGVLEVLEGPFDDSTPIFVAENDPFVVRFKVSPTVWLDKELCVPIHDDHVWSHLSFTKGHERNSPQWTGRLRSSLGRMTDQDGRFLHDLLLAQKNSGKHYSLSHADQKALVRHQVRRADRAVTVSVPDDSDTEVAPAPDVRDSIKLQALVAKVGATMGMKLWVPRNDRSAVLSVQPELEPHLLVHLPLNYDETTLTTIENIDVLWLRGRSIMRAFEVEHTTSIYSGILRMADLLALQPNMDIKLHIVAPGARRSKVFQELTRPVFSLLERRPLHEMCTYISYESVEELSGLEHLQHLADSVLDEYAENAEEGE